MVIKISPAVRQGKREDSDNVKKDVISIVGWIIGTCFAIIGGIFLPISIEWRFIIFCLVAIVCLSFCCFHIWKAYKEAKSKLDWREDNQKSLKDKHNDDLMHIGFLTTYWILLGQCINSSDIALKGKNSAVKQISKSYLEYTEKLLKNGGLKR